MDSWTNSLTALLTVAFGCWAGVVAWIGAGIRSDLRKISADLKEESSRLNHYIVQTERRLAVLEDRVNNKKGDAA